MVSSEVSVELTLLFSPLTTREKIIFTAATETLTFTESTNDLFTTMRACMCAHTAIAGDVAVTARPPVVIKFDVRLNVVVYGRLRDSLAGDIMDRCSAVLRCASNYRGFDGGNYAVDDGKIIRPLLMLGRKER